MPELVDKSLYDTDFYKYNRNDAKLLSVNIVLAQFIKFVPNINSVVDFGCGVGTWLAGLKQYGISDICGFDGNWVDKNLLIIPNECFFEVDFEEPIELKRKFELAISIEVAEHLSEKSANKFVETLVNASDIVLFSAAIPFQGGDNHINEQWPEYWHNLFKAYDYIAADCLRKKLWANKMVLDFHKQSILIYGKKEKLLALGISESDLCIEYPPMSLITPNIYLELVKESIYNMEPRLILKKLFVRLIRRVLGKKYFSKLVRAIKK